MSPSKTIGSSNAIYFAEEEDDTINHDIVAHHTNRGALFFKNRIMRGSFSFSTLDYRKHLSLTYHGRNPKESGVNFGWQSPTRVSFAQVKNTTAPYGIVMLCRFCRFWFYFVCSCPDKPCLNVNFDEVDICPSLNNEIHFVNTVVNAPLEIIMDRSIDYYKISSSNDATDQKPGQNQSSFDKLFSTLDSHQHYARTYLHHAFSHYRQR